MCLLHFDIAYEISDIPEFNVFIFLLIRGHSNFSVVRNYFLENLFCLIVKF